MRLSLLAVLVVSLFGFAALQLRADENSDALKKLQGTWSMTSAIKSGNKEPAEKVEKTKVIIEGNKLTITDGRREEVVLITLDPSKTPAWIDMSPAKEKGDKKNAIAGIYKLDADTLQICFHKGNSQARPKDFSPGEPDGDVSILYLKK